MIKLFKSMVLGLIFGLLGCSGLQHDKSPEAILDTTIVTEELKYIRTYDIYRDSNCVNEDAQIIARTILDKDTITDKDSISGKLFFTGSYLRELAECNEQNYLISAKIYNQDKSCLKSYKKVNADTINFTFDCNSLKLEKETKENFTYLFRSNLTAYYYKADQTWGYDTTFVVITRVVKKK